MNKETIQGECVHITDTSMSEKVKRQECML